MENQTSDLSLLTDTSLKATAKNIIAAVAANIGTAHLFSLKDATKAISNFNTASANARKGDKTAVAIRDLTKEALIAVLNNIQDSIPGNHQKLMKVSS